jgi:acyl carrier protein
LINEQDIRTILCDAIGTSEPDKWPVNFNFLDNDIDSLDHATFLLSLEEKYEIIVPEESVAELSSIQSVLIYAASDKQR